MYIDGLRLHTTVLYAYLEMLNIAQCTHVL